MLGALTGIAIAAGTACSVPTAQAIWPLSTAAKRTSGEDQKYLQQLARDTWACIDHLVDPQTQLPYDNLQKGEWTSVTNIGLYIASLTAAVDMDLLPRAEARKRLGVLLVNLGTFTQWNGFTQSWNSVLTGRPASHDPWISVLDSGNYYAGLMVGRAYFPELKDEFSKLIDAADWTQVFNPETNLLRFGYNSQTGAFNGDLSTLGSDARLAYFIAIGRGQVPPTAWESLNRDLEERYGLEYFQPGWQGGGLFMQFISGLILDEPQTLLGISAANFAYAQVLHARNQGYPVWGWSACAAPTGEYLGMGALRDEVVTPHASVLAVGVYPKLVTTNLRTLEAMGAREPWRVDGQARAFGFRDSIDLKTRKVADNYLLLDQCMLFLSLANHLDRDVIRKTFKQDPVARQGYKLIKDLKKHEAASWIPLRDVLTLPGAKIAGPGSKVRTYQEKVMQSAEAVQARTPVRLDGDLSEWTQAKPIVMGKDTYADIDTLSERDDLGGTVYFMWDETYLYFAAKVVDPFLTFSKTGPDLWKDNCIELYVAPQQNNFVWGTRNNFQIGLAPSGPDGKPQAWAWFQDGDPGNNVQVAAQVGQKVVDGRTGYLLEARIRWEFLGVPPSMCTVIGVSPAIHFIDAARRHELKLNWSFLSDGKSLGRLTLVR